MSIPSSGMLRLNWVCRCSQGFLSAFSPPIHILEGEKVCIQVMTPAQAGSALAAIMVARISSGVVTMGL